MISKPRSQWRALVTITWFLAPAVSIGTEGLPRFLLHRSRDISQSSSHISRQRRARLRPVTDVRRLAAEVVTEIASRAEPLGYRHYIYQSPSETWEIGFMKHRDLDHNKPHRTLFPTVYWPEF
jgi:hypothetical protein